LRIRSLEKAPTTKKGIPKESAAFFKI